MNRDWRHYFQDQELDNAYQRVEIEKRDISEEGSDEGGSDSDPSEDNFDQNEILEKVYCLKEDNATKVIQERKERTFKFIN